MDIGCPKHNHEDINDRSKCGVPQLGNQRMIQIDDVYYDAKRVRVSLSGWRLE
jgi:hypothetical protein